MKAGPQRDPASGSFSNGDKQGTPASLKQRPRFRSENRNLGCVELLLARGNHWGHWSNRGSDRSRSFDRGSRSAGWARRSSSRAGRAGRSGFATTRRSRSAGRNRFAAAIAVAMAAVVMVAAARSMAGAGRAGAAAVTGLSNLLTTHQRNTNDRDKQRDAEH